MSNRWEASCFPVPLGNIFIIALFVLGVKRFVDFCERFYFTSSGYAPERGCFLLPLTSIIIPQGKTLVKRFFKIFLKFFKIVEVLKDFHNFNTIVIKFVFAVIVGFLSVVSTK